ncbi:unnamed protein product [Mucor fragilis]
MSGVRNLLVSDEDMDGILHKVQLEKARLVKKEVKLWNEAGGKQEMTFYQRFASYLNTLMIKIGLNMLEYVRRTFLFVLKCIFISRCA